MLKIKIHWNVQKLANDLKGDEKESNFTERQLDTQVIEAFSGCTMTLRQVLGLRVKLFHMMYKSGQIPASNQINQIIKWLCRMLCK